MTGSTDLPCREISRVEFGPDDLRRVREVVRSVAAERIPDRADNAVLAVHEVALNSIVHGGGHGVLRIAETDDSLVFTVEDEDGTGTIPALAPAEHHATSGRGLWIAQRLSDQLVIDTRPSCTSVRVHLSLVS